MGVITEKVKHVYSTTKIASLYLSDLTIMASPVLWHLISDVINLLQVNYIFSVTQGIKWGI